MSTAMANEAERSGAERQVVALHLGEEVYGVDIAAIHTVLTPQPVTPVPGVPACVRGVMNLRGRILPVLDLRARLGLPPPESGGPKAARVVIVESGGLTAGLVVDSVSEVLRLPADSVEPAGAVLGVAEARCLSGIGRIPGGRRKGDLPQDRLLLLLDVAETLALVAAGPGAAPAA
jgi:purine-binding chemotaxis protein CheW